MMNIRTVMTGTSMFSQTRIISSSTTFLFPRHSLCWSSFRSHVLVVVLTLMWTQMWYGHCDGRKFMERETKFGRVKGLVETVNGGKRVEKYLGIPYARPPLGKLRFEPPQAPEHWNVVLKATELPPACPQPRMGVTFIDLHVPGFNRTSEDCLYLNIHTPKQGANSRHKFPVVVFVHGGSYENGMGALLDGDMLASYDVTVVTFNYRLGALGFLSAPNTPFQGNYGMLDQIEVLKWVQDNIAYFGGDPALVTIDGHSAGGCSVGLLMLSPLARGLFTGVIEQSGSPFAHWAVSRHATGPSLYFKSLMTALGCGGTTGDQMKRCVQGVPTDVIERVILNLPENLMSMIPSFRPAVDGYFLPDLPEVLAASGEITGVRLLTGTTRDEGLAAAITVIKRYKLVEVETTQKLLALMNCFRGDLPPINDIVEAIMEEYAEWPYNLNDEEIKTHFSEIVGDYFILAPTHKTASVMTALNLTVFVYSYEYRSKLDQWEGIIHGSELFYLAGFPLKGHANFRYDDSDKQMSRLLLQLWANFARNGLPSVVPIENFHMPRFTLEQHSYTKFHSSDGVPVLSIQQDMKPNKLAFWNQKVPEMYQQLLNELLRYPKSGTVLSNENRSLGNSTRPEEKRWDNRSNGSHTKDIDDQDSDLTENATIGTTRDAGDRKGSDAGLFPVMQESNSWILIAACIGLSILTVLLSACYCQVRRQVNNLIRQCSVSSGQPML